LVSPAPYGSCASTITTSPPPVIAGACSQLELSNAASACSAGDQTAGCIAFFQFEQSQNFTCYSCLLPFDFGFGELTGLFNCAAPYVRGVPPATAATCNHDTGCVTDCTTQSCSLCDPSAVTQCESQVRQGQCMSFLQSVGADCDFSGANVCNPQNYGGNFGQWLQGVGANFCQ